jgi:hypothetical protein
MNTGFDGAVWRGPAFNLSWERETRPGAGVRHLSGILFAAIAESLASQEGMFSKLLACHPGLFVCSNGFMEELLYRGPF